MPGLLVYGATNAADISPRRGADPSGFVVHHYPLSLPLSFIYLFLSIQLHNSAEFQKQNIIHFYCQEICIAIARYMERNDVFHFVISLLMVSVRLISKDSSADLPIMTVHSYNDLKGFVIGIKLHLSTKTVLMHLT